MLNSTDKDLISVIIPVYNGEAFLSETIESVFKQTYQNFEIIIIDDGSTDKSGEICQSFGDSVSYFYQNNCGAGQARNNGFKKSNGDFVAFLDTDDYWLPTKLEKQVAVLQANQEFDAVTGQVLNVLQSDWKLKQSLAEKSAQEMRVGFLPSAFMIRREAFLKVGDFVTDTKIGEVIDWFIRVKEVQLKVEVLPDLLVWRRIHGKNLSIQKRFATSDYVQAVKRSLDRRRMNLPSNEK